MSYRPEGWVNPFTTNNAEVHKRHLDYEAGADAMLKALRRQGDKVDIASYGGQNCYYPILLTSPAKGTVVFIPDEEIEQ